ncbi:glycerophosphodiester phosphodiesterase [Nakamurella lactea]|uniref:glycerophosphodiester phosphodiesterase n=1 Tax=Nakamurella lactea TaxID=459515 RepID=UPI000565B5DB|nr:glycerophosphodiester phosphodiesterase [Nakamurella lactea]
MTVLSIAHRGEPLGHRENTVEAVTAAIEAGAEMIEIDVRLTADGAPVLLHDATLARLWGVQHPLGALDLAQVQQLEGPGGERIPGLEEIARLATQRNRQLMVDLPAGDAGPVAFDLLERLGVLDGMLFAGETGSLRAHAPAARIALSWERLALPDENLLAERRPEYFNPYFRLLTAEVADRMHERGVKVSVWTVDHPGDMAAAIAQGADAIISNRIAELIDVIEGHQG